MSGVQFTLGIYAQSGLFTDYFGLGDTFTQQVPVKITNTWSGGLYFVAQLNSPPAWYSAYSGVALSGANAGSVPLGASSSDVYVVPWNVSVSGQIAGSGLVTDSLTLSITAYASGFLSGTMTSANVTFTNTLFNRYSGFIKVFGDDYLRDAVTLRLTTADVPQTNGGFNSGQIWNYAMSFIRSGWERDIGPTASVGPFSPPSGFLTQVGISWSTPNSGVDNYALFRWNNPSTKTQYSPNLTAIGLLAYLVSGDTSITDAGGPNLKNIYYRHQSWQNAAGGLAITDSGTYLSAPSALDISSMMGHSFQTAINLSGTYSAGLLISGGNLGGPFYAIFHLNKSQAGVSHDVGQNDSQPTSGSFVLDAGADARQVASKWYRYTVLLNPNSRLYSTVLIHPAGTTVVDDMYVVSVS